MSSSQELKRFIDESQWHHAINLIRIDSSICRKRYTVLFVTEGNEMSEVLPIHHACSKLDVPMELITTLLLAYPESISKTEFTLRRTCLHIAILKGLPDTVISTLLEAYPEATKVQDRHGRVPLHYACSNLRSVDLIKKIIMCFPRCIQAPDRKNWTSLHVAVTKNTHPDLIAFMLALCPDAALLRTSLGATPLELMMDSSETSGMGIENSVKVSKIIIDKVDELNEKPEAKIFTNAKNPSLLPIQMNSYGFV